MHKQTLKNLIRYNTDLLFDEFCKAIYPDFSSDESKGYLTDKYHLFQRNFIQFLAELDDYHLECCTDAIQKRFGSDDPGYFDIVDKAKHIIAISKDSTVDRNLIESNAKELLAAELYPFKEKLEDEERKLEVAVINVLIEQLEFLMETQKKHYYAVWGGNIIGTAMMTEAEAKSFNENPAHKEKQLWVIENVLANRRKNERSDSNGH